MVVRNEREAVRVRQQIKETLAKRDALKTELAKLNSELRVQENYYAFLVGKAVDEISQNKSIADHLSDILRELGRPAHAKELRDIIKTRPGLERTALQTVTGVLIRNANKGKRFKRVAPNVYDVLKEDEENLGQ